MLSFPSSFRQKSLTNNWFPPPKLRGSPYLGNPGSATAHNSPILGTTVSGNTYLNISPRSRINKEVRVPEPAPWHHAVDKLLHTAHVILHHPKRPWCASVNESIHIRLIDGTCCQKN